MGEGKGQGWGYAVTSQHNFACGLQCSECSHLVPPTQVSLWVREGRGFKGHSGRLMLRTLYPLSQPLEYMCLCVVQVHLTKEHNPSGMCSSSAHACVLCLIDFVLVRMP